MNRFPLFASILFLSVLVAGGCADSNDNAPDVDEAHPEDWIFVHGEEAREDLTRCRACHGENLQGREEAVSCFDCHFSLTEAGTFTIHPPEWGEDVIEGHQNFAEKYSWTTCDNWACHGEDLKGGRVGPSCFNESCHADTGGSPPAPHPTEGFIFPDNHGPVAQNDLVFCRNCHGRPPRSFDGGFVADPEILANGGNCSGCHPAAGAHPVLWTLATGRTHGDIVLGEALPGCVLCHKTQGEGESPLEAAPNCTECHPAGFAAP